MSLDQHFKQQFEDTAKQQLVRSQSRPLLMDLLNKTTRKGEAIFVDAIGTGEDGDVNDYTDLNIGTDNWEQEGDLINSRAKYEAEVAKHAADDQTGFADTYAEWKARLGTPHMEIERQRTMLSPRPVRWGYTFKDHDQVFELTDPQSQTMQQGMRRMFRRMDALIMEALFRGTMIRKKYFESSTSPTAMPATQVFDSATGTGAPLKLSTLTKVMRIFEENEADDEPVYGVISPAAKEALINEEGAKLHSTDFVDKHKYFHTGRLPEVYGIHLIPHAKCPANKCAFFTKSGLRWNTFMPLYTKVGEAPNQQFDTVAFMKMLADCQRIDDHRVVQVTLTAS